MIGGGATSQLDYFMDLLLLDPNVEDYGGRIELLPPAYLYKTWAKATSSNN
jgi:hypothetical protein